MSDLCIKFLFGTEEHNKLLLSFINESIMEREVVLDVNEEKGLFPESDHGDYRFRQRRS